MGLVLQKQNPTLGTSQKGKQFQDAMLVTYNNLIKNQFEEELHDYNKLPEYSKAFYLVPVPYQESSMTVYT